MSVKLQTLEHLDGKQVRFSTITSQYPEMFVKRKRNTGELIISTDLDPRYGMHHIYAGGEHIASGYGFATTKTRNDLTYIQETYTGLIKYFNDAYTYHTNAYNWLTGYVINSYKFILDEITYNSYKNITVDQSNNTFIIGETTYTLHAQNGTISFKKDIDNFIRLTSPENYYLQKSFLKYNNAKYKNIRYATTTGEYNKAKYVAFANIEIYIDRSAIGLDINKLYYRFKYKHGINKNSPNLTQHEQEVLKLLNSGIWDGIYSWTLDKMDDHLHDLISVRLDNKNYITIIKDISIPIVYGNDVELELYTYNSEEEYNNPDSTTNNHKTSIKFKWINPILYSNLKKNVNNKLIDKNSLSDMNIILDDYIINKNPISNIQVNTLNNSYNCVMTQKANYSAIEPMFYISSDTKHRENNEGGMLLLSDSESNDLIDEILKEDNEFNEDIINYNIYISEIQNIETTLRFDIDFK